MGILLAGAVALVVWRAPLRSQTTVAMDAGTDGDAASIPSADAADPDAGAPATEDGGEPDPGPSDAGTIASPATSARVRTRGVEVMGCSRERLVGGAAGGDGASLFGLVRANRNGRSAR